MIGFRDMTFCRGDGCSKFGECPRSLTSEVKAKAAIWWGSEGAPIAEFEDPKQLNCWEEESKP